MCCASLRSKCVAIELNESWSWEENFIEQYRIQSPYMSKWDLEGPLLDVLEEFALANDNDHVGWGRRHPRGPHKA